MELNLSVLKLLIPMTDISDTNWKKLKCRTRKNIPFEFNDEYFYLKHDFQK